MTCYILESVSGHEANHQSYQWLVEFRLGPSTHWSVKYIDTQQRYSALLCMSCQCGQQTNFYPRSPEMQLVSCSKCPISEPGKDQCWNLPGQQSTLIPVSQTNFLPPTMEPLPLPRKKMYVCATPTSGVKNPSTLHRCPQEKQLFIKYGFNKNGTLNFQVAKPDVMVLQSVALAKRNQVEVGSCCWSMLDR